MQVPVDKVGDIVLKQYMNYSSEVNRKLGEAAEDIGNSTVKRLKSTSPKRSGKGGGRYAKGWKAVRESSGPYVTTVTVHNKTDWQLTHLLENGHATRNGGRTKAYPHIFPAEQEAVEKFKNKAKEIIANG